MSTKLLTVLCLLAMCVQLIKPLGYPGLRQRRDFWKIPAAGFLVMMIMVLVRP
ncbi:hypothetical protein PYH37_005325 [Sinorhizobium numidicum]|uniref:Transmembrane protein n=1 Tax=Sinorhizobium numidicum TaxID=680248 RepID=A0ABY8CYA0_9HYPH|nr:hypothetical protein [Sinorhizobium numidicum]WEX76970.1 hypothetical protein PYH37_005325 [Sinorhizobium numidicum]WEX83629.1 hypothetical protein PYH38_002418 [Sinorhizobium numidicum]